jgi:rubredoxin
MKQIIYILFLLSVYAINVVISFAPLPTSNLLSSIQKSIPTTSTAANKITKLNLFGFGEPKDDGSPGDYVCKDCGYVFTKGPEAWAKLDDKYRCPPCGAPKFRFKKVPKGSASGKVEVKKNWFGK